jgi:hypothetical protein
MGNMATDKGTVKVDKSFFYFMRTYEGKTYSKIDNKEVDVVVECAREYVRIINSRIKPFVSNSIIKRGTKRRFVESWKELRKANQRIKVPKPLLFDLKGYVPSHFIPVAVLIEELFPVKDEKEKARFMSKRKK